MAEMNTLARPYAKAVFSLAQEQGDFAGWSATLQSLAAVVNDPQLQELIGNPRLTSEELVNLIAGVAGAESEQATNLLSLLSDNNKLAALPDIAAQYELLRNEAESTIDAEMVSATEPTDAHVEAIRKALAKRLGREVKLSVKVDEALVGGALIRAGDLVIDGTVKTRLVRLESTLTAN